MSTRDSHHRNPMTEDDGHTMPNDIHNNVVRIPPSRLYARAWAEQDDQPAERRTRLPLYHGTSLGRAKEIIYDGCLRRRDDPDDPSVSLTVDRGAAEYFACLAAGRDGQEGWPKCAPVVLEIDGFALQARFYDLCPGTQAWEVECRDDIEPLDEFLITAEPVSAHRIQEIIKSGRSTCKPTVDHSAGQLLAVGRFILHLQAKDGPQWWT